MSDLPIDEIKFEPQEVKESDQKPVVEISGSSMKKKALIIIGSVFLLFVVALALAAFLIVLPIKSSYDSGMETYGSAKEIYAQLKNQDLVKTEEEILKTQQKLALTKKAIGSLSFLKAFPFLGNYVSDVDHLLNSADYGLQSADILVKATLPYVDLLGLKGKGSYTGGTTEDRIVKMVETLGKVSPEIDKVAEKIELIKKEVDQIDPNRYPEAFQGKQVRSRIVEAKNALGAVDSLLTQARPMVKKLPTLLGSEGEVKYMILFQNDGELRPTGGFITAYAIFRIEKGKINLDTSDDIYKLDDTVSKKLTPPDPISKYLNVYGWRLRDSNFSPDYKSSMQTFESLYSSSSQKKPIAGIIAMDTHVLLKLMDVIGPISIYGTNFTTKTVAGCNCPMVIYELEKYADEPKAYERGSRKDIIGVLLSEMMKRTLSSPKTLLGNLVPVAISEATSKHILVYLKDADSQAGVEALNIAGRIKPTVSGVDYLHINDANLGGAKSNLYIKQKVSLNVSEGGDKTTHDLIIDYQHPQPPDNCSLERKAGLCLSGIYRDYVRVYLPKGSEIVETRGFESKSSTFEDLDHTVVDGFFTVVPLGLAKIQIKYNTPNVTAKGYSLVVQKQPGTTDVPYKITYDGKVQNVVLSTDQQVDF